MNWFDTTGLTSLAKSALKEAQKTIDKALDIQDDSSEEQENDSPSHGTVKPSASSGNSPQNENSVFFSSWGLTASGESSRDEAIKNQPVVTESPSKSSQSLWGSFAGSFFEQPKSDEPGSAIIRPPKAKSLNIIPDAAYDSQDDMFSKSQLVMSETSDSVESKPIKSKDEITKIEERRGSSRSNRLSLVSSRNSSDSVEVLSQSLKTTPDSEPASHQSLSHSSSVGLKLNSESVEILPDSLVSPSSIECLGLDSYCSDKNSSTTSSKISPDEISDKKSTPIGDRTERPETADSVSLVADDDEDTMSYNSISECTAPTVLDTDEKMVSPFPRTHRESRKAFEKDFIHLEAPLPARMYISENSSNDGSWSDRTLNADNDSINLEVASEEPKKDIDPEDILMEKLSDSSSFYNVNVSGDMCRSESMAFVKIETQQCCGGSPLSGADISHRENSPKERSSPISSDSKSDIVKIGSDRTSGHTSGDEMETTTSSDIEIIPSPNGDNGHGFCRSSPAKFPLKSSKFDGSISPNLVELVLGKSLATKIRGHNRELSEASVQSNTSDESQGSENERLMRRLCEMAEILEARENRLMEVSRNYADVVESNMELKGQLEAMQAKRDLVDLNMLNEDYTQRISVLEKKFQQAIREKDLLRKQLDTLKVEYSRKCSTDIENTMKEKDEMITQLQEEGEKLSRQQLQHSNIIKKLRSKEKDNEQVIKGLRDKVAELAGEVDRLKRSLSAKEELEVSQIEAVYRLTNSNKKLEIELAEVKSALEDSEQRAESVRVSLEAARGEAAEWRRRARAPPPAPPALAAHLEQARLQADSYASQLQLLRAEMLNEERRWASREEALRQEVREAREGSVPAAGGAEEGAAGLLRQLAALQQAALRRDHAHAQREHRLHRAREEAEAMAAKAAERERLCRTELSELQVSLRNAEETLDAQRKDLLNQLNQAEELLRKKAEELDALSSEKEKLETQLQAAHAQVADLKQQLAQAQQDAAASAGRVSPQSTFSDMSATPSRMEEGGLGQLVCTGSGVEAWRMEETLALVSRRSGEVRELRAQLAAATAQRDRLRDSLGTLSAAAHQHQSLQEQYDALLQMYGEKEEQLSEARLDLHEATALYRQQLQDLLQQLAAARRQ